MSISLRLEQEQFIQQKLESGKYSSADEVIFEAFRLSGLLVDIEIWKFFLLKLVI